MFEQHGYNNDTKTRHFFLKKKCFYFLFNKAQYRFEAKLGNTGKSQSNHHVWGHPQKDELQIKIKKDT